MRPKAFAYALLPKPPAGRVARCDVVPKFLELMRWPDGVSCPRCRKGEIIKLKKANRPVEGRYRYHCRRCRRQFTVTTRTGLHRTHVPLEKWLRAIALAESRGENLKARDLARELKITHKTARAMRKKLELRKKDKFLMKLCPPLKMCKTPEAIFRRLFPDAFAH
jgi:transposase-like protein